MAPPSFFPKIFTYPQPPAGEVTPEEYSPGTDNPLLEEHPPIPEEAWRNYYATLEKVKSAMQQAGARIAEARMYAISYHEIEGWENRFREADRTLVCAYHRLDNAECAAGLAKEKGRIEFLNRAMEESSMALQDVEKIDLVGLVLWT